MCMGVYVHIYIPIVGQMKTMWVFHGVLMEALMKTVIVDCRDLALKKKIVPFFETVTLHVIDPFKGPFISAAVTHTRQLSFAARL